MPERCVVCGKVMAQNDRLVLVRGKIHEAYCSELCLRLNLRKQRKARAATRRRWFVTSSLIILLPACANVLWHRYRAPPPEVIASGSPDPLPLAAPVEPVPFGPAWPPTDEDWMAAFSETHWIYPLPGPIRRRPTNESRIFGPEAPANQPSLCRLEGHCGVNIGGDLWGEHVYAVHDGVVDRVHATAGDEQGGQYVRIAHFGGMVFTHYFHLAATPRGIFPGAHVKAGDVIGLLGDTGIKGSRRHLTFTLSIRPSSKFSEVYWDPKPWMEQWPLRVPPRGTVAGLASLEKKGEAPRRRHSK